jgi:hypothetical protein
LDQRQHESYVIRSYVSAVWVQYCIIVAIDYRFAGVEEFADVRSDIGAIRFVLTPFKKSSPSNKPFSQKKHLKIV